MINYVPNLCTFSMPASCGLYAKVLVNIRSIGGG